MFLVLWVTEVLIVDVLRIDGLRGKGNANNIKERYDCQFLLHNQQI